MSGPVIIRLQNLPLEARSIDIRKFFDGLLIPDGGVHIIGGERGDAFIAFQSDEDARLAMSRDGNFLCNSKIKLFLSSKNEMQNVISAARNQLQTSSIPSTTTTPTAATPSSNVVLLPTPPSIPTSIEKILFNKTSSLGSGLNSNNSNSNQQNPLDILNSITKLFSNNKPASTASTPSLLATPTEPKQEPIVAQQQHQQQQQQLQTSSQPNISINEILNLLKNNYKPSQTSSTTATTAITPSSTSTSNTSTPTNDSSSSISSHSGPLLPTPNLNIDQSNRTFKRKYEDNNNNSNNNQGSQNNLLLNKNLKTNQIKVPLLSTPVAGQAPMLQSSTSNSALASSSNNNQRQQLDPIIRVKNFAPNCSYKDIRTFLQGIQIEHNGIKFIQDTSGGGHHKGQAFVRLVSIIDLKKALCRNGQFFEDKQIEVFQSNESELNGSSPISQSIQTPTQNKTLLPNPPSMPSQQQQQQPSVSVSAPTMQTSTTAAGSLLTTSSEPVGFYIKIYGLPAKFDEPSLKNMFNNVKFIRILTSNPTPIQSKVTNQDGSTETKTIIKAKKLCEVETQMDVEKALTRQDERVGKNKVQIFQISRSEFEREISNIKPSSSSMSMSMSMSNTNTNTNTNSNSSNRIIQQIQNYDDEDSRDSQSHSQDDLYLFMSGVPYSAKQDDVRQFFQSLNIKDVTLLIDSDSLKPNGECCCEFSSKLDRDRALNKHDQLFRNRVVKIKQITYAEYQQLIAEYQTIKQKQAKKLASSAAQMVLSSAGPPRPALLQTPVSPTEKPKLLTDINQYDNDSNSSTNSSTDDQETTSIRTKYSNNNNNGVKRNNSLTNSNFTKRVKPSSSYINTSPSQDDMIDLPPLPPELQKYKNSIVLLSNVSYEATREDILELFRFYSPIEQTLKIRHDDRGQPTGDAIVACRSHDEALKACRSLNGVDFMGRNIRAVLISP